MSVLQRRGGVGGVVGGEGVQLVGVGRRVMCLQEGREVDSVGWTVVDVL